VINTNGHTISYGFEDIANYLSFIILCHFTKIDTLRGQLRHTGWRQTLRHMHTV